MKDFSRKSDCILFGSDDADREMEFCIDQLLADRTHRLGEEIVHHLTFEEVLGALLAGRAELKSAREFEDYWNGRERIVRRSPVTRRTKQQVPK